MLGWLIPLGLGLGFGGLNFAIRRALAAERVVESAEPEGLPWRAVRLPTANGKQLFAWFIPAAPGAPALAVMHGWGGNAEMMLPLAGPLHAAGYSLLLLDARCHGRSDDDSFASLPRFAEDLEAGLAWLRQQAEVDPAALGVVGHSVGAGAALLVAARQPELKVVLSLAAFAHPASMMRRWLAAKGVPYWPFGAYVLAYVQHVIGHRFEAIAPLNSIAAIDCPVLLVHGLNDPVVPVDEARAIHARRRSERVELLLVAGSHDDYGDIGLQFGAILAFMARACPVGPTGGEI